MGVWHDYLEKPRIRVAILLAESTLGYPRFPMDPQGDRPEVPWLTADQLEHFSAKQAKKWGAQQHKAWMHSLGMEPGI